MIDADEWDWIVEHARGSFDHLIVATTPAGIHAARHPPSRGVERGHLRRTVGLSCGADRRAVAAGCRPRALGGVPALVRAIHRPSARRQPRPRGRAAGDDHHPQRRRPHDLRREHRPRNRRGPKPGQPGCLLALPEPTLDARAEGREGDRLACCSCGFSALARACRVPAPSANWRLDAGPTYDNSIGELELDEQTATVTIRHTCRTTAVRCCSRSLRTPVERADQLRISPDSVV